MNTGDSRFHLNRLLFCIILAVLFSNWIAIRPCLGKTSSIANEKNKLVICIPSPVVSLDPTDYRDRVTQIVLKNMFDSLTARDAEMNVVPQLAESWKALNKTTWEFRLRRGVRFHNGDPFTAEDVKFTLERVVKQGALNGKTSPRKSLLGPLSKIEIIDDYTVRMETEKPWVILPLMLTLQEIVPKKYIKEMESQGFQKNPVGTGPFRFLSMEENKRVILERFEKYYGGSPENRPVQRAPLKYLIFQTVPFKVEQIAMLKKGECDIIYRVPAGTLPILKTTANINVLNCQPTRSYFAEINSVKPPFNDQRVRLALNYAIDKQAVVDHILIGHGKILPTVLLPSAFAYNSSLKPYPYDPRMAKKLLFESGFPDKRRISIYGTKDNIEFASLIAGFFTRIGRISSIATIERSRPDSFGKDAKWDIFVTSWGNSTLDPVGILVPKFKSDGRGNYSKYSNKKVDKLFFLAEDTLDIRARKRYYKAVQEIIFKDVPMIFGYAAEEFYGVRERVRNFIPSPSGMMNMHDVYIKDED